MTTILSTVDDLDFQEGRYTRSDGSVSFGWDGEEYEIDLSAEHASEFFELVEPYIRAGRKKEKQKAKPELPDGSDYPRYRGVVLRHVPLPASRGNMRTYWAGFRAWMASRHPEVSLGAENGYDYKSPHVREYEEWLDVQDQRQSAVTQLSLTG